MASTDNRSGGSRDKRNDRADYGSEPGELRDKLVYLNRVSKVVKGGKRFSFNAIVVVGDGIGRVGIGLGKANEVPAAIKKAVEQAKKTLITVPIVNGSIPFKVNGHYGAGKVILLPASPGTGVIAGGGVRSVIESCGIHDVLTKSLGSNNPHNVVKATMDALRQLKSAEQIAKLRGKSVEEII